MNYSSQMIAECPISIFHSSGAKALQHCLGVLVNKNSLVRCELIDTPEKASQVIRLAQQMQQMQADAKVDQLRLASLQLNHPATEWGLIQAQQCCLNHAQRDPAQKITWAHLILPMHHLFLKTDPRLISDFDQKALDRILHQINAEAWAIYCEWIGEDMLKSLKGFKAEALDEYQLQARLEDFLHELNSTIRADVLKEIDAALQAQQDPTVIGDKNQLLALEKVVVAGREKLKRLLAVQYRLLVDIDEGIAVIEDVHPELHALKMTSHLLHLLMGQQLDIPTQVRLNWGQRLMLLQLLDQQLHVIPVVNCDTGIERTNAVFAIRMCIAEMAWKVPLEELIAMCMSWGDLNIVDSKHQIIRKLVLSNSKSIGIIDRRRKNADENIRTGEWGVNLDILEFIPKKVTARVEGFEEEIELLESDTKTGRTRGLTREGRAILRRLGLDTTSS